LSSATSIEKEEDMELTVRGDRRRRVALLLIRVTDEAYGIDR